MEKDSQCDDWNVGFTFKKKWEFSDHPHIMLNAEKE
jgi:hypothetical protein